jgi:uncharacterized protein YdaU (DUF1376 family)
MVMKSIIYFPHDCGSRQNEKIQRLLFKHGMEGFGIFWAIVENLYTNGNCLPTDYEMIAFDLRTAPEKVKSIVEDFQLFFIANNTFKSKSVDRRLKELKLKSDKAKESARKRWDSKASDANALPTHSERITDAMLSESDSNAIKEKKEKESKVKEIKIPFGEFWYLYDKKVGDRQKCEKKWNTLSLAVQEKIIAFLPEFKKTITDKQFQPYPQTFLNGKRWEDEIQIPADTEKKFKCEASNSLGFYYPMLTEKEFQEKVAAGVRIKKL